MTDRAPPKRASRAPKKPQSLLAHSDAVKARALVAFGVAGTVKGACEAAKIGRRTWYDWMEADPSFAARVVDLTEEVTDELEEEAIARAKSGSDTLIIFLLKSRRPGQYRERQEVTVVSADVRQRLDRQVQLIASRATWTAEELLAELSGVWT